MISRDPTALRAFLPGFNTGSRRLADRPVVARWGNVADRLQRIRSFAFAGLLCCVASSALALATVSAQEPAPQEAPAQEAPAQESARPGTSEAVPSGDLREWIAGLESEAFYLREQATQQLERAGMAAVRPLADAVAVGQPETMVRGIRILGQLARSDDPALSEQASGELERLRRVVSHPMARYAGQALESLAGFRREQAVVRLEQLGMRLVQTKSVGPFLSQIPVTVVEIDERWSGSLDDLKLLRYIRDVKCLALYGPQIDDQWLAALEGAGHLQVLKLHHASVTADGLQRLTSLGNLLELDLMYVRLDRASVDVLSRFESLSKLALFGTGLQAEDIQPLHQLRLQRLDFRKGAFLGVAFNEMIGQQLPGGLAGCRVDLVHQNGPAFAAGLRTDDLIVRVDGTDIVSHNQLIELIGTKGAGDRIQVELYRQPIEADAKPLQLEITMGEWP